MREKGEARRPRPDHYAPACGLRTDTAFHTVSVADAVEPEAVTTQVMPLIW